MQKQLFNTADSSEFEKYFFEENQLDFSKYLTFLKTFLETKGQSAQFIQAFIHVESKDGTKEDVLTVETAFLDQTNILRIWGVKDLESGTTLKVTVELIHPETKEIEEEYTIIENGIDFFLAAIPEE